MNERLVNEGSWLGSALGEAIAPPCWLYRLGTVPYDLAWQWQQGLVAARRSHPDLPDVLLLLEHPPVYTLGAGADERFLKFVPAAHRPPVVKIERGGEVTYHGPGQIVGYPILNLRRHQTDLHWYLRQLEEVIIQTLAALGLPGERLEGFTGVWLEGCKVAAIGIKVSRWITMHGFALNVCPDLSEFQHIVPCGIADKPVGSLVQFRPDLTQAQVQGILEQKFAEVFGCHLVVKDAHDLSGNLAQG
ncbi:MAG TPA: lipoyl(octanoyl) transferase LipB [Candidatus Obscuribacterales bacterium]